MLLYSDIEVID